MCVVRMCKCNSKKMLCFLWCNEAVYFTHFYIALLDDENQYQFLPRLLFLNLLHMQCCYRNTSNIQCYFWCLLFPAFVTWSFASATSLFANVVISDYCCCSTTTTWRGLCVFVFVYDWTVTTAPPSHPHTLTLILPLSPSMIIPISNLGGLVLAH